MSRRCLKAFRKMIATTWSKTARFPSPANSAARTTSSRRVRSGPNLVDSAFGVRRVERKRGDLDVEMLTHFRHHAVAADHETRWRRQRNAAGVLEGFPCLERGFLADNARAPDLLQAPERIGNAPMPRLELNGFRTEIGNVDGVSPEKIAVAWRRPLRNKAGCDGDLNLAGYGAIHLYAVQFTSLGLAIRLLPGIMTESPHERKAAHGPGFDRTRSSA